MTDQSKMTVSELVRRYAEFKTPQWTSTPKGESNAKSWHAHSKSMLEHFGPMTLGQLCEGGELRSQCHKFNARRGLAPATVRKQLQALVSPMRWAWDQGWIPGLPPYWLPPATGPRERELSETEIETLLEKARAFPTERHVKVFIYLALFTPAQKHAILNLTWDRVDFSKGVILFDGRAYQARQRVVMHESLLAVMREAAGHKEPGCKHVVSWRGKPVDSTFNGVKSLLLRAHLDDVTMNDLRRWRPDEAEPGEELEEAEQEDRLVISYSTKDGMLIAAALCMELEARGQLCWIAPRNVGGGAYSGQIIEAIENGSGLVVVLTPEANSSSHVLQEVNAAHDSGKLILPVIVDNTTPSSDLKYYVQTPQQTKWSDASGVASSLLRLIEQYEAREE